jgi:prophage maintenance system killer protein
MTKEKNKFQQIESQTVCKIYKLLNREKLISFAITQEAVNKVDALVANINANYFGHELYKSREEKSVAYLYFLIKNHPFTDGNKRTAALTFEVVCYLNNLHPNYGNFTLDELAVFIEGYKTEDHQKLITDLTTILF